MKSKKEEGINRKVKIALTVAFISLIIVVALMYFATPKTQTITLLTVIDEHDEYIGGSATLYATIKPGKRFGLL